MGIEKPICWDTLHLDICETFMKFGISLKHFPGTDNEMKYDNLARSLAMMEAELERAGERVKNAESKVVVIEDELGSIGENQKQLEISEEKARKREEKYQEHIKQLTSR